jgi:hypothetical protein
MLKLVLGNVQQLLDVRKRRVAVVNKSQARQAETAGSVVRLWVATADISLAKLPTSSVDGFGRRRGRI